MKAAVLEQINAPLVIQELEIPLLKSGQVLVKVLMAGICGAQLQEQDGLKGNPAHLPHLLGHEGCGIVEEVGPEVIHIRKGDKVVMHWRKGVGMDVPDGGVYGKVKSGPITTFSQYSIVSENRLTAIDPDVPNDFATLLGCALSTALAVVENEARPKTNDVVCVRGCGGLGLAIILALKLKIVIAIGIDVSKNKKRLVESLGGAFLQSGMPFCDILIDTISNEKPPDFTGKYISLQPGGTSAGGFLPSVDIPRYVAMWRKGLLNDYKKLITRTAELDGINIAIQLMRQGREGRVMIDIRHRQMPKVDNIFAGLPSENAILHPSLYPK